MPWNSSTKIMTGPLNLYSKNGSYGDIQQAVRYDSSDLGDCISYGHINIMAKYKPFRNSALGWTTAQAKADARKQANYGFDLSGGADSIWFYDMGSAITACSTRHGNWPYQRPRGKATYNEEFRYFDFLNDSNPSSSGYAADAPNPYTFTFPGGSNDATISSYASSWSGNVRVTMVADAGQIYIGDFVKFGILDMEDLYYALLYRNGNDIYIVKSSSTVGTLSAGNFINIPISFPSPATYTGCVVVTDSEEDGLVSDGAANIIYLPYSNFSLTYNQMSYTVDYAFGWLSGNSPTISESNGLVIPDMLSVEFKSDRPTFGQPYEIKYALFNGDTLIWEGSYEGPSAGSFTIPNHSVTDIDTIDATLYNPSISGVSYGDVLTLRTQLETTGANAYDVKAGLRWNASSNPWGTISPGYMLDTITVIA